MQITALKFSNIVCVAFPLAPQTEHLPSMTEQMSCVRAVAVIRGT